MRFKIRGRNDNPTDIDDSAIAPHGGFLDGYVGLPTYKRNDLHATISDPSYVRLTISHVIGTIVDECYLARRILFESARLQKPFYSTGPVKLAENEATVDKKLIELDASIRQGNKLIVERLTWEDKKDGSGFTLIQSEDQKFVLEGERFKKALRMNPISCWFRSQIIPFKSHDL